MPPIPASPCRLVVVGAGPAGLTAACEAREAGHAVTVLERDPEYVGGIARTVVRGGYRFDIGGHRFFSKSAEITLWWRNRLPDDFIRVKRGSRILYRGRFFDYPLRPWNALSNLGVFTSLRCVLSYVKARLKPKKPEISFEDWVSNRFGRLLFGIFFKTYTEKVWGVPTSELSADWAAQRIKGLSLFEAVRAAFRRRGGGGGGAVIKTLVDSFEYPRLGPGQMWEKAAADLCATGGRVEMGRRAVRILHAEGRVTGIETEDAAGNRTLFEADQFILSMPLRETAFAFDPPLPEEALAAAGRLGYRDFITVALVVDGPNPFPDNWIYIHDPEVRLGRIQNFRNWSAGMVPGDGTTCLGLEYFCFEGDGLWTMADEDLVALGRDELARLGLVAPGRIRDGYVVRIEKAYPVYDSGYRENVAAVRLALAPFRNLQVAGRNGMHKYNNQDHSMMTGLLAARNLGGASFDLWKVNTDAEYHEKGEAGEGGGRAVPKRL